MFQGTTPAKVPVTLLCGLQGSGKGALLKHFLEEPHPKEASMRLAVIVNDLEQIDIDEKTKLTEQSDDEVMEMVNGSICCKLENDLVEQIIKLTQRKEKRISHIIIEASGVSEPHEIAPLFEIEDSEEDDSDGEENAAEAEQLQLADVARLDACVAVIDSAEFDTNLGSMRTQDQCLLGEEVDDAGMVTVPLPELMMDHLEFANIIVLSNLDKLQCGKKTEDLKEKLTAINTNAKIVEYNKVGSSVSDFLNTNLYKDDLYLTKSVQRRVLDKEQYYVNSIMIARCAEEERERLEKLGKTPDIKPFVYRARKPFHPDRFRDLFLEPFFMDPNINLDDEEEEEEDDDDIDTAEEENIDKLQKIQDEADAKQEKRTEMMGDLLRSKGFFWLANSHVSIVEIGLKVFYIVYVRMFDGCMVCQCAVSDVHVVSRISSGAGSRRATSCGWRAWRGSSTGCVWRRSGRAATRRTPSSTPCGDPAASSTSTGTGARRLSSLVATSRRVPSRNCSTPAFSLTRKWPLAQLSGKKPWRLKIL